MPISSGPNTAGENNLVFNYDTGDIVNSYKGEPTTNLAAFNIASSAVAFNTDTPGNLTQTANSTEATFQGRLSRKMVVGAGYWNAYVYGYNTGVSSTVFAVSYKIKTSDGSHPSTIVTGGYIYGSAGTFFPAPTFTYVSDGWYLATMLYSGTSMTLNSLTGMNGYGPKTFYVTDYQAEALSHSTPFVSPGTSRSVTGSLFDISGYAKSINLSSVSFTSNAQMTFDGTDDFINLGSFGTIGAQYSIECVFNSANIVNYRNVYDMNYSTYNPNTGNVGPRLEQLSSQAIMWIWSGNTTNNSLYNFTSATSILPNRYYHTIFTLNSGVVNTYFNGLLTNSNVSSAQGYVTSFQDVNIGRGFVLDPSRFFSGGINLFRVYNIALSSSEILQNYNQLKTRFNLS